MAKVRLNTLSSKQCLLFFTLFLHSPTFISLLFCNFAPTICGLPTFNTAIRNPPKRGLPKSLN